MQKIKMSIVLCFSILCFSILSGGCSNGPKPSSDAPSTPTKEPVSTEEPLVRMKTYGQGVLYNAGDFVEYATFSSDGQTIYYNKIVQFNPTKANIYESHLTNGQWSTPAIPSFAVEGSWESHAVVSNDNQRVLFDSKRDSGNEFYIWESVKKPDGNWGEPHKLFSGAQPALTKDGTLYFTNTPMKIYRSRLVNGGYSKPELLEGAVNQGVAMSPSIAPDEKYMIFSKNDMKLYISFQLDGKWSEPTSLAYKEGTVIQGFAAYVSPDNKMLYTFSGQSSTTIYQTDLRLVQLEPSK